MSRGIIGIFREGAGSNVRCSVSVRTMQTKDFLKRQFKNEHPNIDFSLDKMLTFEYKGNPVDIETTLRKILSQMFKMDSQYKNWENYMVQDYDKFIAFIDSLFLLVDNIINVREV